MIFIVKRNVEDTLVAASINVGSFAVLQTQPDKTIFAFEFVTYPYNVKNIIAMSFAIEECVNRVKSS